MSKPSEKKKNNFKLLNLALRQSNAQINARDWLFYLLQSSLNCSSVSGSLWKSRIDLNLVKLTFPLLATSYSGN